MRIPSSTLARRHARVLVASLATTLAACAGRPSADPSVMPAGTVAPTTTGAFVVRLGDDTMVVERYTRTANRLESWSVNRQPFTIRRHFVATLDGNRATRLDYQGGRADGSQPISNIVVTYGADSATTRITVADTVVPRGSGTVAARSALPNINNSWALMELAVNRFLAGGAQEDSVMMLQMGAPQASAYKMRRAGPNTVEIDYFGDWMIATVDGSGRLQSVDGSHTTNKVTVTRTADMDIEALITDYVARDRAGRAFGQASRRDSVRASIAGATIAIDYFAPSRRGRTLLGGIIPYDQVWRTGANNATSLVTSADLDIGGTTVPAGRYTLFTLPTRAGWTLIVNKQTGQWGTEYHQEQDLARIPLTSEPAPNGPERMTIAVEPGAGRTGRLRILWGDVALSAPITVK